MLYVITFLDVIVDRESWLGLLGATVVGLAVFELSSMVVEAIAWFVVLGMLSPLELVWWRLILEPLVLDWCSLL